MIILHRPLCTSTQDVAKDILATTPSPFCIIADAQTAGRGQRDHIWQSVAGNLHITFALPWHGTDTEIPAFALSIAQTLHQTIKSFVPSARLKLPNDIYIEGKKVAGMIAERYEQTMLVGMGVNVAHAPLEMASCLNNHNIITTPHDVAQKLIRQMDRHFLTSS